MTGIVLVTHDGLGESLRRQAEVILGRMVAMTTVSISYEADPDSALGELLSALAMSADQGGTVVLTDLPGATPHNLACRAAEHRAMPVVSGLNLPMLLKVISHSAKPARELAELASLGGRQGIVSS
ncbi:MAG: PTS sugar transporter subunit IIA [Alphaproteobacteria bacterium]|nr:PTS sugar transporter subunit IIA [Alphaproteobacteria bacterium]